MLCGNKKPLKTQWVKGALGAQDMTTEALKQFAATEDYLYAENTGIAGAICTEEDLGGSIGTNSTADPNLEKGTY